MQQDQDIDYQRISFFIAKVNAAYVLHGKHQRFGQFVLNTIYPEKTDPGLFYANYHEAYNLFVSRLYNGIFDVREQNLPKD